MRRFRRAEATGALAALTAVVGAAAYVTTPRDRGVDGEWAARAIEGRVVAERVLVGPDNSALDLGTGKTIRLGSVRGGTRFIGDGRLIIATPGRIDSARLDASARWTWRAPQGSTAAPVAATAGATLVRTCAVAAACRLVGLDAGGRQSWETTGFERPTGAKPPSGTPDEGALPKVFARLVPGGGVALVDPVSGRQTLQPGERLLAVPEGPVVVAARQGGQCVVSAYPAPDASWTRLLGRCPDEQAPQLSHEQGTLQLTWPSRTDLLDLKTGRTVPTVAAKRFAHQVAAADGLVATRDRETVHRNPFRWGRVVTILRLRQATTGEVRAQLVSDGRLELLRLDHDSVVVREGAQVIRYAIDEPDGGGR